MAYDILKTDRRLERAIIGGNIWGNQKKKRKTLTPAQRIHIWENPKKYGRKCNICHEKITKLSELQLDHTRAHIKGGTRLALAHAHCNRMKSSGSLRQIQKTLGIKSKTKRKLTKKRKRRNTYNPFGVNIPRFRI